MINKLRLTAENSVMKCWWKRYSFFQRCWVIETKTSARQGHFPWIRQSMRLFRRIQTQVSNWIRKDFNKHFPTDMYAIISCLLIISYSARKSTAVAFKQLCTTLRWKVLEISVNEYHFWSFSLKIFLFCKDYREFGSRQSAGFLCPWTGTLANAFLLVSYKSVSLNCPVYKLR